MYVHRIVANRFLKIIKPERFEQTKEIARWYKDGGDKKFRYSYPLSESSVVIDVGAYHGEWTDGIYKKYHPTIFAFEPVREYYSLAKNRFKRIGKIKLYNQGLAGKTREENIYISDVSTSIFKKNTKPEKIRLVDIVEFCKKNGLEKIDLIKINIEGGEYELLNRIINSGLVNNIDCIQVQFHDIVPEYRSKMESLQRKLSKTHKQTYSYWLIWDNWVRKGIEGR